MFCGGSVELTLTHAGVWIRCLQLWIRRIPRSMPKPPDREKWLNQREAFLPELAKLYDDEQVELFFGDEAGFDGDLRPRQRWVKRGSRPTEGCYGGLHRHLKRQRLTIRVTEKQSFDSWGERRDPGTSRKSVTIRHLPS